MMPPRMRLDVLSIIYGLIPGRQRWTCHHLHGMSYDLDYRRVCLLASLVDLCCRAHVSIVLNGP